MEPRIATLLGGSSPPDRNTLDPLSLPPLSITPRRPQLVKSASIGDDLYAETESYKEGLAVPPGLQAPQNRQKAGAPLAEVLNDETPSHTRPQQPPAFTNSSFETVTAPFSGRLSDILVDPSQHYAKRRKIEPATSSVPSANDNSKLQLPKPVQLPKKSTRRPRIPPLLQGLHQPPPLPPQDRLFPPITGEGSGFGRDRVGLRSPVTQEHSVEKPSADVDATNAGTGSTSESNKEKERLGPQPTSDKENKTEETGEKTAESSNGKPKEAKKRKKWSEQETKDLLQGVSKFGIGSWKKILNCSDYDFNSRTAVDLKDRFRTCCPGEGLKERKPASKKKVRPQESKHQESGTLSSMTSNEAGSSQETLPLNPSAEKPKYRKTRADKETKSQAELVEMGIQAPFFKTKRRERRDFTEQDDENLLKGFKNYGAVWHSMRDDSELGFSSRHPTDLRDRFRIRYPDMYGKAGYKLKSKDDKTVKAKEDSSSQELVDVDNTDKLVAPLESSKATFSKPEVPIITTSTAPSNLRAHAILQPLSNFFPEPFDDFPDLVSEYDGEGGRSPITLSRTILHWADANPSSLNTTTGFTSMPTIAPNLGDLNLNPFPGSDGLHIDPRATFQIPLSSISNSTLSVPTSQTITSTSTTSSIPTATTTAPTTSTSSKHTMDALLRTPNLPTIVYPHVPMSSARNAMHNLPPPADLLSGVDLDLRSEQQQSTNFLFDDTMSMSFAIPSGVHMLAPIGTGNGGRNVLGLEGRGDEVGLERSVLNSSI